MVVKKPPYKNIAGVTPCPGGWLVLPARLAGITVAAEEAFVLPRLFEVLDFRPTFEAAAINAPMGLFDTPSGQFRPCDRRPGVRRLAARRRHQRHTVARGDSRLQRRGPSVGAVDDQVRHPAVAVAPRSGEGAAALSLPELLFGQPGRVVHRDEQRRAVVDVSVSRGRPDRAARVDPERLPGVDDVVTRTPPVGAAGVHLLQAAALLFTARRGSGRAMSRMPIDPTWDDTGMRMEIVR